MTAAVKRRERTRMSGDDRERAILESTRNLLRQHTLHEVSIDDITRGAGISRPGFYFYFTSKDDVLLALLTGLHREATRTRDAAVERAGLEHPEAAWHDSLRAFFDVWLANRDIVTSVEVARATSPAIAALWAEFLGAHVDETAEAITSERARGAAPAGLDARHLAACLTLMTERTFGAVLSGTAFGLAEDTAIETLLAVYLQMIYGSPLTAAI